MTDQQFALWMSTLTDIAAALRRLRELQGLTLQEVAELAGVDKSYVYLLEVGKRQPRRDTLIALLLAAYSLPVPQANQLLLLAGYAPLHYSAKHLPPLLGGKVVTE